MQVSRNSSQAKFRQINNENSTRMYETSYKSIQNCIENDIVLELVYKNNDVGIITRDIQPSRI